MREKFPQGKYMGSVKLGSKGQIVIPKEVREMFHLAPGDSLVLVADRGQGIAMQPYSYLEGFMQAFTAMRREEE